MRLDPHSLDKLLDLMVMVFKWQMFLSTSPDDLLNITLRHLHGVGKLMPDQMKIILIEQSNRFFYAEWNELSEEDRYGQVRSLNKFLSPFNIRISLLIRMKLQNRDGSFVDKNEATSSDFFRYYINNLGKNLYEKIAHFPHCQLLTKPAHQNTNEIDCLFQQFAVDIDGSLPENPETTTSSISRDDQIENNVETKAPNSALDELKKKCKFDVDEEAPPVYADNFQELLNMLDGST